MKLELSWSQLERHHTLECLEEKSGCWQTNGIYFLHTKSTMILTVAPSPRLRICAIFTDTLSNISNFSPVANKDPSLHPKPSLNLYPPFIYVVTTDLFSSSNNVYTLGKYSSHSSLPLLHLCFIYIYVHYIIL